MKDKIFGVLQRVGRSFMLPIAILPVAGLLLGIGSSFTNETTIATYGLQKILGSGTLLNSLLIIMNKVGSAVFDNLPLIFAVGNAPTALVRLYELIEDGFLKPELIIGVPVGFVNVVQSKELIMKAPVPYIVAQGRKGGSNIAACIVNALLYMINNSRD